MKPLEDRVRQICRRAETPEQLFEQLKAIWEADTLAGGGHRDKTYTPGGQNLAGIALARPRYGFSRSTHTAERCRGLCGRQETLASRERGRCIDANHFAS